MTKRTCKDCERPLTEEDGEYCPHCTAKKAGELGKKSGFVVSVLGVAVAAIVGIVKVFGKK